MICFACLKVLKSKEDSIKFQSQNNDVKIFDMKNVIIISTLL
jgi:hypothetical protein